MPAYPTPAPVAPPPAPVAPAPAKVTAIPASAPPPPTSTEPAQAEPAPATPTVDPGTQAALDARATPAGNDAFAALDAYQTDAPAPTKPSKNGEKPRDDNGKFKTEKPADKPAEPTTSAPAPPEDDSKLSTPELRRNYKAQKVAYAKLQKDFDEYKKTPRDDPEKPVLLEKINTSNKRLQELESRAQTLEQELKFTAYEKSDEYKNTYHEPYVKAYRTGMQRVASLKIVPQLNDEGDEIAPARRATAEDFDAIMKVQDDYDAGELANKMFGPVQAAVVMQHRENVIGLNAKQMDALETYRKNGAEIEKQRREQWETNERAVADHFQKSRDAAVEKYPKLFKPDEADPEGSQWLAKGKSFAERCFNGGKPMEPEDKPWTAMELAANQATLWNKGAAFDRVIHELNKARKELAEARKDLSAYEDSEPKNGDGGGRAITPKADDATNAVDAFNKRFGA